jgi:hypothetical protein
MTRAQHASPILEAVRAKIGLQQRGLYAFDLAGNQLKRVDRSEEIATLEKQRKRVTPPERGGPTESDRCGRVRWLHDGARD